MREFPAQFNILLVGAVKDASFSFRSMIHHNYEHMFQEFKNLDVRQPWSVYTRIYTLDRQYPFFFRTCTGWNPIIGHLYNIIWSNMINITYTFCIRLNFNIGTKDFYNTVIYFIRYLHNIPIWVQAIWQSHCVLNSWSSAKFQEELLVGIIAEFVHNIL
jgi:hypothetical protein